ncbi:hypothetical protein L1887_33997 [Cichorium endivia]|nr:hypothetical protein L1887_33997 [Cichorium endivia]
MFYLEILWDDAQAVTCDEYLKKTLRSGLRDSDHQLSFPLSNRSFKTLAPNLQIKKPHKFATLISSLYIRFYQHTENPPNWRSHQTHTLYLYLRLMIFTDNFERHPLILSNIFV